MITLYPRSYLVGMALAILGRTSTAHILWALLLFNKTIDLFYACHVSYRILEKSLKYFTRLVIFNSSFAPSAGKSQTNRTNRQSVLSYSVFASALSASANCAPKRSRTQSVLQSVSDSCTIKYHSQTPPPTSPRTMGTSRDSHPAESWVSTHMNRIHLSATKARTPWIHP